MTVMPRSRSAAYALTLFLGFLSSFAARGSTITVSYAGNSFDTFYSAGTLPQTTYGASSRVSGSIELDAPLAAGLIAVFVTPVAFNFSDGVNTISDANATSLLIPPSFEFWTDMSGQIVNWAINLAVVNPGVSRQIIQTLFLPGTSGVDAGQSVSCGAVENCIDAAGNLITDPLYVQQARIDALPGTWTFVETSVPEPGSLLLVGGAMLGAAAVSRRRSAGRRSRWQAVTPPGMVE